MLTRINRTAAMIAACILGICLSPVFAKGAPAWGLFKASFGCDKTPEWLVVTRWTRSPGRSCATPSASTSSGAIPAWRAWPCSPTSFRRFETHANFAPGGARTQITECLVWSISDASVSEFDIPGIGKLQLQKRKALFYDADGAGGLTTALVVGTDYTPQAGESCGATRAAVTTAEAQTSGPISVKLKYDGGGPNGGLLFVGTVLAPWSCWSATWTSIERIRDSTCLSGPTGGPVQSLSWEPDTNGDGYEDSGIWRHGAGHGVLAI